MKKKPKEKVVVSNVDRQELVEGEVCAICQEEMNDSQPLTFCRKGCGNNFHIECIKVFGESRRQSKENIICPLCRQDWGGEALAELRREMDTANKAPNVHKGTSCRKCKTKPIRCERYRCVQCKNVDLCARCFKTNAHSSHAFVMKQNVFDPWVPALREHRPRTAISADLVRDLESRELSANDYDLLLQLDHKDRRLIQDYLVKAVPGTKVKAENAKTFGELGATCSICAQSLRIKAALHSTLCGHVFHDSCLARSLLSQVYSCPFAGCDHALLPGLLYLQKKHQKREKQQISEAKPEPSSTPTLDASLTVLGLQQQRLDVRSRKAKREISRHSSCEADELPLVSRVISMGGKQHEQLDRDAPATSRGRPAAASNQLEHEILCEEIVLKSFSGMRLPRGSTSCTKRKPVKQTQARSTLPSIDQRQAMPSFPWDEKTTETRLDHAEKIRNELKAVERERLQKQHLLRDERRQRHRESDNSQAFVGGFLGAGHIEVDRMAKVRAARAQQSRELKQKSQKRREHARELNQVAVTLPDLFVGSRRLGA